MNNLAIQELLLANLTKTQYTRDNKDYIFAWRLTNMAELYLTLKVSKLSFHLIPSYFYDTCPKNILCQYLLSYKTIMVQRVWTYHT